MHQHTLTRVIILGLLAILGIVGMQTYWVATTWNLNDTEFSQKAKLALYGVARQLAAENNSDLPSRDIVRQRSSNYFIVNIESEIDALRLEILMQQELVRLSLDLPFEYAIFDCTTDQMAYGGYCQASTEPEDPVLAERTSYLAPDENLLYYFGIKFPTRTGYLWEKMQLVVFLSLILMLTVAFFGYSVVVMLRQRRLATMQKDFIDNMTHEFKTPLSTIRIAAGVFLRDERVAADGRLSRYAQLIHQQYERLNEQVEKVLQIARIEQGNFEIKKESTDLHRIMPDLLGSARVRAEERSGTLEVDLPGHPLPLLADPLHLSNILHNLLDNAIKYSGEKPRIRVRGELRGQALHLSISDSGPGIAPEHQERLFEKFYRIPTGDVHDVKGFGLGLFYVAQICRAHGWTIRVESSLGQGATFRLQLPLLPIVQVVTT
ncbi:HAMP domain-containing sensor histidine kinase [Neolewinella lacunae]|uniref:histidine kinase n=1 Tax=Neolewinella lacunae TaxID=1517758 RepID=A0A923PT57_9BACT|nr:HAMP domain-containing sensor histidine kinase [Neolewinella lacunae]MBC6996337.1 HAMP domain-containing histidine kinase [Neolewinella lacunae]MDN3636960.1 HAMP domain-containing sensor histidine kinase [Neolewinella lacunae]